jgi:transposase
VVGATAIVATITDPKAFRSGRDMAAWIGLVPRQDSTGGKQKLGWPFNNPPPLTESIKAAVRRRNAEIRPATYQSRAQKSET